GVEGAVEGDLVVEVDPPADGVHLVPGPDPEPADRPPTAERDARDLLEVDALELGDRPQGVVAVLPATEEADGRMDLGLQLRSPLEDVVVDALQLARDRDQHESAVQLVEQT